MDPVCEGYQHMKVKRTLLLLTDFVWVGCVGKFLLERHVAFRHHPWKDTAIIPRRNNAQFSATTHKYLRALPRRGVYHDISRPTSISGLSASDISRPSRTVPCPDGTRLPLSGLVSSRKLNLDQRRIRLRDGPVYQILPSFVMPYMIAKTNDIEKGLYLRRQFHSMPLPMYSDAMQIRSSLCVAFFNVVVYRVEKKLTKDLTVPFHLLSGHIDLLACDRRVGVS